MNRKNFIAGTNLFFLCGIMISDHDDGWKLCKRDHPEGV